MRGADRTTTKQADRMDGETRTDRMRDGNIIPAILLALMLALGWAGAVFALTPEEVLALKKAGVGDETIRMMIRQETDGKRPAPGHAMGRRELRDGGGGDAVEYSTGRSEAPSGSETQQQQMDRAWDMLRHLIVDKRKAD